MRILVDTNVLLRAIQRGGTSCESARRALKRLHRQGYELCLTTQNVREFWNVCTRPTDYNGLGISISGAERRTQLLERYFTILPDSPLTYAAWRQLVQTYHVIGGKVHDAHLAATMKPHGVTEILTFNTSDFRRFEGIRVIDPQTV